MDKDVQEQRLPQITLVLPHSSTNEDAKEAARELISNALDIKNFEILHVEMVQEGSIRTKLGTIEGRRYSVAFRQLHGKVIFVHPDYESIVGS